MDEVKKPVAEQAQPIQEQAQPTQAQPAQTQPVAAQPTPAEITQQAATTAPVAPQSMGATQQTATTTNTLYKLPIEETSPKPADALATQQAQLEQWKTNAQQQANNQIDYAVNKGVTELERGLEDAQPQFQQQQQQVDANARAAMDNAALYAEMRGDRGGIGQAQYNAIQNQQAQGRLQVAQQQTKLSTDVTRQIADLRAQGEFDKADAVFNIAQNYLSQLMSLQQWYASYAMSYDEFQASLYQWQKNYEMSMAQITGAFADGTKTFAATQADLERAANAGNALLGAGIMPSEEQLSAMGITSTQAQAYMINAGLIPDPNAAYYGGGGGYVPPVGNPSDVGDDEGDGLTPVVQKPVNMNVVADMAIKDAFDASRRAGSQTLKRT